MGGMEGLESCVYSVFKWIGGIMVVALIVVATYNDYKQDETILW